MDERGKTTTETGGALPLLLSVQEAAKYAGVGRDYMYTLVRKGDIPSVRIGARSAVPRQAVESWVREAMERG